MLVTGKGGGGTVGGKGVVGCAAVSRGVRGVGAWAGADVVMSARLRALTRLSLRSSIGAALCTVRESGATARGELVKKN